MTAVPIPLNFPPGIQRDGTALDADRAVDALWCRWRNGRPRKIPGFKLISDTLSDAPRRIHMFYDGANVYVHVGTASTLQQFVLDVKGNLLSSANRTPAGLVGGPALGWTLDAIFDTTSNVVQLVAHAVPDLLHTASSNQTVPYIGQINAAGPVVAFSNPAAPSGVWVQPNVAGGVVAVQPYVFAYDNAGLIQWSAPNLPLYLGVTGGSTGAGSARASAQKIVSGLPLRGGGVNSPAAIFWSLSEVITATFVGSSAGYFAFNTVSPSSSILSTDCVIEYDGLYFWAGIDRFMVYNGTVQEVPNPQNQDWFFDNLNKDYAAKCFAMKVPRYGEIWWCAPLFGATEPSHAIIYNVREACWYDTALPGSGRSAAFYAQGLSFPVMGEPTQDANGYKLWMHETGLDQVQDGMATLPVRSYFDTPYLAGPKLNPPSDEGLSIEQLEPDIIQSGNLSITVIGAANARSGEVSDSPVTLKATAAVPQEQMAGFKTSYRLPRLRIESNTLNGNYVVGRNILHGSKAQSKRIIG